MHRVVDRKQHSTLACGEELFMEIDIGSWSSPE
jgi:hypothetical protein